MNIDATARIASDVELASEVEIGPGVIIDGPTRIGAGTRIQARAYIGPHTTIGKGNLISFGAIIGHEPQDYAFNGEPSCTIIGNHNIIREYATIHTRHRARQRHPGGRSQFYYGPGSHGPQLFPGESRHCH